MSEATRKKIGSANESRHDYLQELYMENCVLSRVRLQLILISRVTFLLKHLCITSLIEQETILDIFDRRFGVLLSRQGFVQNLNRLHELVTN
jgi:hypothetical protein